jgi:tetrahydromethanopterin S-methyltransferase subunit C
MANLINEKDLVLVSGVEYAAIATLLAGLRESEMVEKLNTRMVMLVISFRKTRMISARALHISEYSWMW